MNPIVSASPSRYQALGCIGRGGMAEILLAATRSSGVTKLAVLKCLWPDLAEEPGFLEMFMDEARLGARLAHPNVVQTYEVVEHEGRLAMAMEYVDGPSLLSVLTRLPGDALDLRTRLRIVAGVLGALEYAHTLRGLDGAPLNVVHRDVSPNNVIITYDGHVKLLDFGIAKTLAARHHTRPGGVKGKLAYLAPEAIRSEAIDRRADVFSAGVILWEILAGRRLWGTGGDGGLARRLTSEEAPPHLPPELQLPAGLNEVCMRALALDPADRHQSAAELGADLERFGIEATDTHARRLGRVVAAAFQPERAKRQEMIAAHLRRLDEAEAEATVDVVDEYASYELREPPPRRGRAGRVLVVAAAAVVVALASGVRTGPARSELPPLPSRPSSTETASMEREAPPVRPAEALAVRPQPARGGERVIEAAARRTEHGDRPSRNARRRGAPPLDLSSDDVLGLDGAPLAASASAARD
jgi:serine/threonine-protein kinase